jgi:hypothetical protein
VLAEFRGGLARIETLVSSNPENAEWQRDLSISYIRIADALASRDAEAAQHAYEKSLAIRERLAGDAADLQAQHDLALVYERIGNLEIRNGRIDDGVKRLQQAITARERIATAGTDNVQWKRELALSYERLALLFAENGKGEAAKALLSKELDLRDRIAAADPANAELQSELAVVLVRLAVLGDQPQVHYRRALEIVRKLAAEGKLTAAQTSWPVEIEQALAAAPN